MSRSSGDYHHGDLRRALVTAAVAVLAEQPPARLSLRGVAREAGVSHAAPYHHFGDRAGLLKAVGDQCMREFLDAQEQAAAAEDDPARRLVALGQAYVDYAATRPHAFALIFDPVLCPPDDPSPERAPLIRRNEELLAECVGAHLESLGRSPALLAPLATALWGTVHGLATLVGEGHLPQADVPGALDSLVTGA